MLAISASGLTDHKSSVAASNTHTSTPKGSIHKSTKQILIQELERALQLLDTYPSKGGHHKTPPPKSRGAIEAPPADSRQSSRRSAWPSRTATAMPEPAHTERGLSECSVQAQRHSSRTQFRPRAGPHLTKRNRAAAPAAICIEAPTCHKGRIVHHNCTESQLSTAKLDAYMPCPCPGKGPRCGPVRRKGAMVAQRAPARASAALMRHAKNSFSGCPRSELQQAKRTSTRTKDLDKHKRRRHTWPTPTHLWIDHE